MNRTRITTALGVTGLAVATLAVGLPAAANAATAVPTVEFTLVDYLPTYDGPDGALGSMQQDHTWFQVVDQNVASKKVEIRDEAGTLLCTATLRGSVSAVGSCATAARLPDGDADFTATPLAADGSATGAPAKLHAMDERRPTEPGAPTDPGTGDEDAATPAPTIQNVRLEKGTLTADVTTTGEGLVYVFDAAGKAVGFSMDFAGHANGTTAQVSVDKVKPGEQLSVSLLGKAGESTRTPFTAPVDEEPGNGEGSGDHDGAIAAPGIGSVTLVGGTMSVDVVTKADGMVSIHDVDGKTVGASTDTLGHPHGTTATVTVDGVQPGAHFSASLKTRNGDSARTPFTAPSDGSGTEQPDPFTVTAGFVSYDPESQKAVITGTASDNAAYAVTRVRNGILLTGTDRGTAWAGEPFERVIPGVRAGDTIVVTYFHNGTSEPVEFQVPKA